MSRVLPWPAGLLGDGERAGRTGRAAVAMEARQARGSNGTLGRFYLQSKGAKELKDAQQHVFE